MTAYAHLPTDYMCAEYFPPHTPPERLLYWLVRGTTCPICRVQGER